MERVSGHVAVVRHVRQLRLHHAVVAWVGQPYVAAEQMTNGTAPFHARPLEQLEARHRSVDEEDRDDIRARRVRFVRDFTHAAWRHGTDRPEQTRCIARLGSVRWERITRFEFGGGFFKGGAYVHRAYVEGVISVERCHIGRRSPS